MSANIKVEKSWIPDWILEPSLLGQPFIPKFRLQNISIEELTQKLNDLAKDLGKRKFTIKEMGNAGITREQVKGHIGLWKRDYNIEIISEAEKRRTDPSYVTIKKLQTEKRNILRSNLWKVISQPNYTREHGDPTKGDDIVLFSMHHARGRSMLDLDFSGWSGLFEKLQKCDWTITFISEAERQSGRELVVERLKWLEHQEAKHKSEDLLFWMIKAYSGDTIVIPINQCHPKRSKLFGGETEYFGMENLKELIKTEKFITKQLWELGEARKTFLRVEEIESEIERLKDEKASSL